MKVNAEKSLPQWSTSEDKRITRFGKLLRLTRIDELPQLISVLKGENEFDISLVLKDQNLMLN